MPHRQSAVIFYRTSAVEYLLGGSRVMLTCPSCTKAIGFRTIAFATFPVWLRCPHCKTKLRGNAFIKAQGFVIIPVLFAVPSILIFLSDLGWPQKALACVLVVSIVSIANIVATLVWGRYFLRNDAA